MISKFCSNILPIYFTVTSLYVSDEHQKRQPVFIRNKEVETKEEKAMEKSNGETEGREHHMEV